MEQGRGIDNRGRTCGKKRKEEVIRKIEDWKAKDREVRGGNEEYRRKEWKKKWGKGGNCNEKRKGK